MTRGGGATVVSVAGAHARNRPPCGRRDGILLWLALVVVVALVLRSVALFWGLPNGLHPGFSLHPDEAALLAWAEWLFDGRLIAKHFIYGGTLFYSFLHGCNLLADQLGMATMRGHIVVARLVMLCCSIASLLVTFVAASVLYGRRTALLAVAMVAVMPGHLFWAQRVRPDTLFALEFALNLWLMARIGCGIGALHKNLVFAGLLLGATVATRFPGAVLAVGYLVMLRRQSSTGLWSRDGRAMVWRAMGWSVAGYLIASPHTLLHFSDFLAGLRVQWGYQSEPIVQALGRGPVWWQYATWILPQAVGYPLLLLVLPGLCCALLFRRREDLALWGVIVAYGVLLAGAGWVMVRYTVPLLPLLAVLAAAGLRRCWRRWGGGVRTRGWALLLLVLSIGGSLVPDVAYSRALLLPAPQDRAALWLVEHLPRGSEIAGKREYRGDLYTLPVPASIHRWHLVFRWSDLLGDEGWRFLVVNREQYAEIERLGASYPDRREARAWHRLASELSPQPLARFASPMIGLGFLPPFTAYDLRQFTPTIEVWMRQTDP